MNQHQHHNTTTIHHFVHFSKLVSIFIEGTMADYFSGAER